MDMLKLEAKITLRCNWRGRLALWLIRLGARVGGLAFEELDGWTGVYAEVRGNTPGVISYVR